MKRRVTVEKKKSFFLDKANKLHKLKIILRRCVAGTQQVQHSELDGREGLLKELFGLGGVKPMLSQYDESAEYYSKYKEQHNELDSREHFWEDQEFRQDISE